MSSGDLCLSLIQSLTVKQQHVLDLQNKGLVVEDLNAKGALTRQREGGTEGKGV